MNRMSPATNLQFKIRKAHGKPGGPSAARQELNFLGLQKLITTLSVQSALNLEVSEIDTMFAAGKVSQPEVKSIVIFSALQLGEMLNAEPAWLQAQSSNLAIQMPGGRLANLLTAFLGARFHADFCVKGVFSPTPALFLDYSEHLPEIRRNLRLMEFPLAEAVLSQADRHLKEVYPHVH